MSSDTGVFPAGSFTPLRTTPGTTATRSAGYAQGYAQGWAAGTRAAARRAEADRAREADRAAQAQAEADQRVQRALAALGQATDAARDRAAPVLAQAESELTDAALHLAQALLGAELSDRSDAVLAAVSRALAGAGGEQVLRIRLNPGDLQVLDSTGRPEQVPGGVEFVAAPELDSGDAVTEFTDGVLDARLGPALQRVREVLRSGQSQESGPTPQGGPAPEGGLAPDARREEAGE